MDLLSVMNDIPNIADYASEIKPIIEYLKQAKLSFEQSVYHHDLRNNLISQHKLNFLSINYIDAMSLEKQSIINENQAFSFLDKAEDKLSELNVKYSESIVNKLNSRQAEVGKDNLVAIKRETIAARDL
jgi:hypothetical protein